jgi:hypothetical protein
MYLIINGKPPSQTEKKYVAVHLNELLLFISNPAIFFSYIMVRTKLILNERMMKYALY